MIFNIEKIKQEDRRRTKLLTRYFNGKYSIAKKLKYKSIIEVGVDVGYSALAFLSANPKASYIGFDNNTYASRKGSKGDRLDWAKKLIKEFDAKIKIIDTQKIKSFGYNADLIHIDGCHRTECIYHDIELATMSLNKGGSILVDDYKYQQRVKDGVDNFLEDNLDWYGEYIDTVRGDMIIKKRKHKEGVFNNLKFFYRNKSCDDTILKYETNKREYRIKEPKVVIDIGAHIGGTSILCASLGSIVYAYEPEPNNFRFLKANVKLNGFEKDIHCFQKAVGSSGNRILYLDDKNFGSFSFYRKNDKAIKVETISIGDVFKENKIEFCDLLKVDCEGSEYEFLFDAPFEKIGQISAELHKGKQDELIKLLKNFYRVEISKARTEEYKMVYCYKK